MVRIGQGMSEEKVLLPLAALLHCRTVVEKQNFVSTGLMTHVEGELFEVELAEFDLFNLGETVKLTVYSPVGIQTIQSIVFAKYDGAIALIQPPAIRKRFEEKREHPRVEISGSLSISHIRESGVERVLEQPLIVPLRNISISGIGFEAPETHDISKGAVMKGIVDAGLVFACGLELKRRDRVEDIYIFGAIMTLEEPDMLRSLRAFVLKRQVENHVESRKRAGKQRSFNG
ncbi:PilZ domain-containing protein [Cohnella faecalis]|uniref:PilZ domain-containing protein n=1 Tax=Cohnella faecalis TaxID=2315694 RepID=A0A398CPJ8_9BACL|nr:PilZ domain-containing protein [Cohnella faecalis]RIE02638.1 PilZ domain-containing protein [Cohnella faecalis]